MRPSLQVLIEKPRRGNEEAGKGAPGGFLDGVQWGQILWHRPSLLLAQGKESMCGAVTRCPVCSCGFTGTLAALVPAGYRLAPGTRQSAGHARPGSGADAERSEVPVVDPQ